MPSINQTIEWAPDAMTSGLTLANSGLGDLVHSEQIGASLEVQPRKPLRAAAAKPMNRRNLLGRRTFLVTYPPAASLEAARNAAEAMEDSIRAFSTASPVLVWVFGTKTHTFSDAVLESFNCELSGLTLRARFNFMYGAKATTP